MTSIASGVVGLDSQICFLELMNSLHFVCTKMEGSCISTSIYSNIYFGCAYIYIYFFFEFGYPQFKFNE